MKFSELRLINNIINYQLMKESYYQSTKIKKQNTQK